MSESVRRKSDLRSAYRRTGLPSRELWFRYLALGGNGDELSVDAQVHGVLELPAGDYNVLAHAVNEALDDLPAPEREPKIAYRQLVRDEELRGR
jgi:hypothetical protein